MTPRPPPAPFTAAPAEPLRQRVHLNEHAELIAQAVELPGDGEHPTLALARRVAPGGATRGPVVLVHGFAQNRYTWDCTDRSMAAWLAVQGWDVYNLELRGHGLSRPPQGLSGERFADYVQDVARVARAFDGQAFFVGHSLGGAASYGAATLAPMRGVVGIGALFQFAQANWLLKLLGLISHGAEDFIVGQGLTLRTKAAGQLIARLYAISDVAGYAFPISGWWPGSVEPPLLEARRVKGFDWTSLRVWLDMSRWAATGKFEYEDAWSKLNLPLLVLAGDEDHLMPPDDALVAYERSGSADKQYEVLNHADHEVHWGHLDLILGTQAPRFVWPRVHEWMGART
ncbi:lysophospholipase [Myxococcota bacterium]|nr:lysophospholipase [Myxococcota bacterium]